MRSTVKINVWICRSVKIQKGYGWIGRKVVHQGVGWRCKFYVSQKTNNRVRLQYKMTQLLLITQNNTRLCGILSYLKQLPNNVFTKTYIKVPLPVMGYINYGFNSSFWKRWSLSGEGLQDICIPRKLITSQVTI